ncbi:MAG: type II toxin-antitoxin system RelE/ParE family toxin [Gammaproteobacteria bacterium]|nr:type II toxin-antitoxin system RelE/ParE family toxin [Gammaproteobacteria bacterium]
MSRDSPAYTRAVVSKIRDTARKLKDFPNAGRIVPELDDEAIRERFVYSYRLIYRIQNNNVLIVAVVHGRRLLEPLLDQISDA